MSRWDEKAKRDAVQSGKGPGEFGPDYSDRKKYQLGYGNESPSPIWEYKTKIKCLTSLKKHLMRKKYIKLVGYGIILYLPASCSLLLFF
jgi:hypothetical protein